MKANTVLDAANENAVNVAENVPETAQDTASEIRDSTSAVSAENAPEAVLDDEGDGDEAGPADVTPAVIRKATFLDAARAAVELREAVRDLHAAVNQFNTAEPEFLEAATEYRVAAEARVDAVVAAARPESRVRLLERLFKSKTVKACRDASGHIFYGKRVP